MNVLMSYEIQKAYKEVNDILDIMGDTYKNKIPKNILKALKIYEAKNYISSVDPELSFYDQNISRDALAIISLLNLMYWIEDEEEKERLKKIYEKNNVKYKEELKEKYDVNKIFKKDKKNTIASNTNIEDKNVESKELMIIKENIFSKIKEFILGIFKRQ